LRDIPAPGGEDLRSAMKRTIAHIDMNAFFASVEQMCNPSLRGKPLIVCGDPERRSVVSTASYEAREYGVVSGMPVTEARRLCPCGVFLVGSPRKYVYYSVRLLKIYSRFTSAVEPFSIDEAFLDLTGTSFDGLDKAEGTGRLIKDAVRRSFPLLAASIGFAPNKYVAKMASSIEKPDGLVVIRSQEEFKRLFWRRPVEVLWGIGEKTKRKLSSMGITTVEDLARAPLALLKRRFGENGEALHDISWGKDDAPVLSAGERIEAKSMGHEHTLKEDTSDRDELEGVLLRLCDQVGRRLRRGGCVARTVSVKMRFSDFTTITRQKALASGTDDGLELFRVARRLLSENFGGRKLRLIGVTASSLDYGAARGGFLFGEDARRDLLERTLDSLKDKYGENALVRAGIIGRGAGAPGSRAERRHFP